MKVFVHYISGTYAASQVRMNPRSIIVPRSVIVKADSMKWLCNPICSSCIIGQVDEVFNKCCSTKVWLWLFGSHRTTLGALIDEISSLSEHYLSETFELCVSMVFYHCWTVWWNEWLRFLKCFLSEIEIPKITRYLSAVYQWYCHYWMI